MNYPPNEQIKLSYEFKSLIRANENRSLRVRALSFHQKAPVLSIKWFEKGDGKGWEPGGVTLTIDQAETLKRILEHFIGYISNSEKKNG